MHMQAIMVMHAMAQQRTQYDAAATRTSLRTSRCENFSENFHASLCGGCMTLYQKLEHSYEACGELVLLGQDLKDRRHDTSL